MNTLACMALSIVAAPLLAGCAYPNQFHSVRIGSPHAVLVGEGVKLTHINGQPTSFWRFRERFCVVPGPTTLKVISGRLGEGEYPLMRFTAEAGQTYSIRREHGSGFDGIVLWDRGERSVVELQRLATP